MKKIFFLIFTLLSFEIHSQSNWFWQNPSSPSNYLYSIQALSESVLFSAGSGGTILKSTNGGQNQIIIKTTDAGQTWMQQNTGTGTVWFWSVKFSNENKGWASGLDKIYKTTNGGTNWNPIQVFNPNASINFKSVSLLSPSSLFYCGTSGMIVKSTNAGDNWTALQAGPTINFSSIQFINSSTGYVSGFLGLIGPASIYKSTNGGNVWVQQTIPSVQNICDIAFLNTDVGIACGRGSKILLTTNGGVNWDLNFSGATSSEILYSVSFLDSISAFTAGGYFNSAYYGLLFKTTNKGSNWNKVSLVDSSGTFYSIQFLNSVQGFACGTGGKLIKTSDGGNTWNNISSGVTSDLRCVYFINTLTGWISGASGVLKKTTNGGLSWIVQTSGTTGNLYSVIFTDENNGHATGNFGVIKTANDGLTWTADIVQTSNPVNSIFFINNNTGWLAGD